MISEVAMVLVRRVVSIGLMVAVAAFFGSCQTRLFNSRGSSDEASWGMKEYSIACHEELGELPAEIDCANATEIPMTRDGQPIENEIIAQAAAKSVGKLQCDNPIMSVRDKVLGGCIPRTRIGRISTQTSDFVFICRRRNTALEGKVSQKGGAETRLYDTVAFIGHNRQTNKACFIERSNSVEVKLDDGGKTYLAAAGSMNKDYIPPLMSSKDARIEKVANQWEPMSIDCTTCHSTKPFVYSPSVSRLKQKVIKDNIEAFETVLPKMTRLARTRDAVQSERPYQLVAEDQLRQYIPNKGYVTEPHPSYGVSVVPDKLKVLARPRILLSPEAAVCAKCHDIGGRDYLRLLVPQVSGFFPASLVGNSDSWSSYSQYAGRRIGAQYIDGTAREIQTSGHHDEIVWRSVFASNPEQNTEQGRRRILEAIVQCGVNPKLSTCQWSPTNAASE